MGMKDLDDKEFAWMQRLEKEIDKAWNDLTPWEKKFMEGSLERFRKYGRSTLITISQWDIITRISEKII
jgi:hypothetical protein